VAVGQESAAALLPSVRDLGSLAVGVELSRCGIVVACKKVEHSEAAGGGGGSVLGAGAPGGSQNFLVGGPGVAVAVALEKLCVPG